MEPPAHSCHSGRGRRSRPTARRRIDRLERNGFIREYAAVLDHGLLREDIEAFVELRFAPGTQVTWHPNAVTDLAEVVESFPLAGDPDALVRMRVPDLERLKSVVEIGHPHPSGARGRTKVLTMRTIIGLDETQALG